MNNEEFEDKKILTNKENEDDGIKKSVTITIIETYIPGEEIPGGDGSTTGDDDNNYGSGDGDLRVEDLDKDKVWNGGWDDEDGDGLPDWIIPGGNIPGMDEDDDGSGGNDDGSGGNDDGSGGNDDGSGGNGNGNGNGGSWNGNAGIGSNKFLDFVSEILDRHFQTLTPSTPNIMLITSFLTLKFSLKADPILNAIEMAAKISLYFSMTIIPKPFGVSGPVILCLNNASAQAIPLGLDLIKMALNMPNDNYVTFVTTIYNHIANGAIIWNVTELVQAGGVPTQVPYVVTVT